MALKGNQPTEADVPQQAAAAYEGGGRGSGGTRRRIGAQATDPGSRRARRRGDRRHLGAQLAVVAVAQRTIGNESESCSGREPAGEFEVVVRDSAGDPVVIRNSPILHDGTPMPTRYWLTGEYIRRNVGRLEAAGGVRRAEAEVDDDELHAAHDRYAKERDAAIPSNHIGPAPVRLELVVPAAA